MRSVHSPNMQNPRAGMALVIVAVLLIVLGGVAGLVLVGKEQDSLLNPKRETHAALEDIKRALVAYQRANHALPCPSDQGLATSHSDYGRAVPDCAFAPAANVILNDVDGLVHIGGVPVKDLAMPERYAGDAWGNRISYAVTASLTSSVFFSTQSGVIDVTGVATLSDAAFVLLSHGENGAGTKRTKTAGDNDINCTDAGADAANCPQIMVGDAEFLHASINMSKGTNYFDDLLVYAPVDDQAKFKNRGCAGALPKWVASNYICSAPVVNMAHGDRINGHVANVGTGSADVICRNSRLTYENATCAP